MSIDPYAKVPTHLQKYVDYINNTGQHPLKVEHFDEDWEPVGIIVRKEMKELGLIVIGKPHLNFGMNLPGTKPIEGIMLRPDLRDVYDC